MVDLCTATGLIKAVGRSWAGQSGVCKAGGSGQTRQLGPVHRQGEGWSGMAVPSTAIGRGTR